MTKKQWVAPSAQLVQFAANEYVAACGDSWIATLINTVKDNYIAFIDNGNDKWNYGNWVAINHFNSSYASVMVDNESYLFDAVVSNSKGHNYDQALEWFGEDERNDFWLTSKEAEMTVSKDSVHKGWYAEKLDIDVTNVKSAHIWWDDSRDGYYVASSVRAARS